MADVDHFYNNGNDVYGSTNSGKSSGVRPARQVFSVTQVNRYVKQLMENDALLAGVFIEGELSNFNAHSSGHLYFTLKDADAAISGVMFRSHASTLAFSPKSGMKVVAFGRLSLYDKTGQYQVYVEYLEPAGIGGLQLAFQQLSEKLEKEGLFAAYKKRAMPAFAQCVAVITSPTGAAVQDIIRIIRERNPATKVVVIPALVQGAGAAEDLVRALDMVNRWGEADVVIIGRGGGSIEDLWAFNEEILARAISASTIPVISAVGHETDFTISDFVADLRAPTPTAAAQLAVFDYHQVSSYVNDVRGLLCKHIRTHLCEKYELVKRLFIQLNRTAKQRMAYEWQNLAHLETLLEKVSPYAAFQRGYALVRRESHLVTSAKDISEGQIISLNWADGYAVAEIKTSTIAE